MTYTEKHFIELAEKRIKDFQILINQTKLYCNSKMNYNINSHQQLINNLIKINQLLQIEDIDNYIKENYKHLQIKEI